MTISLCMIVRNEEDVLGRCLDSVRGVADEIIIVDTGSADRTREIARAYTERVYDFAWEDDFAAARNASFSYATMDYIFWLDADDVLEESEREKLLSLKEKLEPSTHMVMLRYDTAFDEAGRPTFFCYRERLLLRKMGYRWEGAVHEAIAPRGNVVWADIAVSHKKSGPGDPDRNLRIFEKRLLAGKALSPRERFYYGRELSRHGRFREAAGEFLSFLDSGEGWVENCIAACLDLSAALAAMGEGEASLRALLRSFCFDSPRAEVCCALGRHFLESGRLEAAVFWYETALRCPDRSASGGFVSPECRGYIPCLQLCICYDRMGDYEKAASFNRRAGTYKPGDSAVAYNDRYFAEVRGIAAPGS